MQLTKSKVANPMTMLFDKGNSPAFTVQRTPAEKGSANAAVSNKNHSIGSELRRFLLKLCRDHFAGRISIEDRRLIDRGIDITNYGIRPVDNIAFCQQDIRRRSWLPLRFL